MARDTVGVLSLKETIIYFTQSDEACRDIHQERVAASAVMMVSLA